ncbi:Glyceraldehyde-3-phosphate dehydrogenase, partial [Clarias magur]
RSASLSEGVKCGGGAGRLDHVTLLISHHEAFDPSQHHLDPDSFFRPRQSHT